MPKVSPKMGQKKFTKGERTRALIKSVTLDLLVRDGFHDLKIVDICAAAGVAAGTFYIHFKDKTELAVEVVKEKLEENQRYIFGGPRLEDAYEAIYQANSRYVETFIEAGPLNRVIVQMIDAIPEMRMYWASSLSKISARIAKAMVRRCPASDPYGHDRFFVAQAAQGMADSIALQYFAWKNDDVLRAAGTPEALTEKLSILWHRMLYGCDPSPDKISQSAGMLSLSLNAPK